MEDLTVLSGVGCIHLEVDRERLRKALAAAQRYRQK
jgi:hypothetical protein